MIFFSYLAGFSYFLVAKIFRKLQDTVRIVQKLPFERGCRWLQLFSLVFSYLFSNQNHPCNRIPPHIMRSDVNEIVTTPLFITNSWKRVYIWRNLNSFSRKHFVVLVVCSGQWGIRNLKVHILPLDFNWKRNVIPCEFLINKKKTITFFKHEHVY